MFVFTAPSVTSRRPTFSPAGPRRSGPLGTRNWKPHARQFVCAGPEKPLEADRARYGWVGEGGHPLRTIRRIRSMAALLGGGGGSSRRMGGGGLDDPPLPL